MYQVRFLVWVLTKEAIMNKWLVVLEVVSAVMTAVCVVIVLAFALGMGGCTRLNGFIGSIVD